MSRWEKVGIIGVDAGMCWVGDPCYILAGDRPKDLGTSWGDFCSRMEGDVTQLNYNLGHPGLGMVVSTGYGDGTYNVYVRRTREGRIGAVKVVFVGRRD
jgi:hypothetical protein